VLCFLFRFSDVFELEAFCLHVYGHWECVSKLHTQIIQLELLEVPDKKAHVIVLENDMRALKFASIFKLETGSCMQSWRHYHCLDVFDLERSVHRVFGIFVQKIDHIVKYSKQGFNNLLFLIDVQNI